MAKQVKKQEEPAKKVEKVQKEPVVEHTKVVEEVGQKEPATEPTPDVVHEMTIPKQHYRGATAVEQLAAAELGGRALLQSKRLIIKDVTKKNGDILRKVILVE